MKKIIFKGKLSHADVWVEGNLIQDENDNVFIIPHKCIEKDGHHCVIDSDEPFTVDAETVIQLTFNEINK